MSDEWDEEYEREQERAREAMASWREAVAEAKQKFATVTNLRAARDLINDLSKTAQELGEEPWSEMGATISALSALGDLTPEQDDLLEPLQLACSDEYLVFANRNGVVMVSQPDFEADIMNWDEVWDIIKTHTDPDLLPRKPEP